MLSDLEALFWAEKIIAVAVGLQTIELLLLKDTFSAKGVWRWKNLSADFETFPGFFRTFFRFMLKNPNFMILLWLQLASATTALFYSHPALTLLLIGTTLLVSIRWRGTFNGGSDAMTLVVLVGLLISQTFAHTSIGISIGLWYIAIQCCLSYFLAGIAKIQHSSWRKGKALSSFLESTIYENSKLARLGQSKSFLALSPFISWGILAFEISFPLGLLNPELCFFFIGLGFLFHLANFYIFGLNRFLWSWSATYPALLFCSAG